MIQLYICKCEFDTAPNLKFPLPMLDPPSNGITGEKVFYIQQISTLMTGSYTSKAGSIFCLIVPRALGLRAQYKLFSKSKVQFFSHLIKYLECIRSRVTLTMLLKRVG